MKPTPTSRFLRTAASLLALSVFGLAVACQRDETPASASLAVDNGLTALPATTPAPADNPTSPAKVALGRTLFWDPILSGGRDVACATCHHPSLGYADGLDLSIGAGGQGLGSTRRFRVPGAATNALVTRNSQTVLNTAYNGISADGSCDPGAALMFWDGRARSLEAQAAQPIAAQAEMRGRQYPESLALDSVVARLRRIPEYQQLFAAAFAGATPISATNLARALACFERSLTATDTPYDQYLRGDYSALSSQQQQGLTAFVESGCAKCHRGPMLSDYQLHVLGVADNARLTSSDAGPNGTYAFRTPSLRQLNRTAPYMHNGTLATLGEVMRFYDPGPGGPRTPPNPHVTAAQRDALFPQRVTNPQAILAFLEALNSNSFDATIPSRVPSGLPVGGSL